MKRQPTSPGESKGAAEYTHAQEPKSWYRSGCLEKVRRCPVLPQIHPNLIVSLYRVTTNIRQIFDQYFSQQLTVQEKVQSQDTYQSRVIDQRHTVLPLITWLTDRSHIHTLSVHESSRLWTAKRQRTHVICRDDLTIKGGGLWIADNSDIYIDTISLAL